MRSKELEPKNYVGALESCGYSEALDGRCKPVVHSESWNWLSTRQMKVDAKSVYLVTQGGQLYRRDWSLGGVKD